MPILQGIEAYFSKISRYLVLRIAELAKAIADFATGCSQIKVGLHLTAYRKHGGLGVLQCPGFVLPAFRAVTAADCLL